MIKKIFTFLFTKRLGIAVSYILSIFAFAFIYSLSPNDFYHSTVKYEKSFQEEKDDLKRILTEMVIDNFYDQWKTYEVENEDYKVNIREIGINGIRYDNEGITFNVHGNYKRKNNHVKLSLFSFTCKLIKSGGFTHSNKNIGKNEAYQKIIFLGTHPDRSIIFDKFPFYKIRKPFGDTNLSMVTNSDKTNISNIPSPVFELHKDLLTKYDAIIETDNGFPYKIKGSFSRFIYLSANTITGLGLGDILPISNRARWLVTAESLLGLILIGLFLNTISTDRKIEIIEKSE